MLLAIQYPSWLKPEVIPGLPVRWYGLMYVVAFAIAYLVYRRQVKERNFPISEDDLSGMFLWGILGLVAGARIFYFAVYERGSTSLWQIFWPFRNGSFVGLQGMSYHGGVIGCALGVILFSLKKRFDLREILDMFCASIPLGYTFGRIGNFTNAELFGRITNSPLGMIFPTGGIYPSNRNYELIREAAAGMGLDVTPGFGGVLNLPRHPSQLYEALFEGVVLWAIIWLLRNRKPVKGFLLSLYLAGYGLIRFFIEYFREPDADLGYRIQFVKPDLPPALSHPLLCFSTGQLLCFGMIVVGVVWAIIAYRLPNREPIRIYPAEGAASGKSSAEQEAEKNARRKQRRKLRSKLR